MRKIVLVSCVSKKNRGTHKAKDLYVSPLFRKAYEYAESLNPDKIFILSAKYHLLDPEAIVEDYNKTLNTFSSVERKEWTNVVLKQMSKVGINLEQDEIIFLAGKNYWQEIISSGKVRRYERPYLDNNLKGIGYILKFFNDALK